MKTVLVVRNLTELIQVRDQVGKLTSTALLNRKLPVTVTIEDRDEQPIPKITLISSETISINT